MLEFRIDGRIKAKQSFRFSQYGHKYTPSDVKAYAFSPKGMIEITYTKWEEKKQCG